MAWEDTKKDDEVHLLIGSPVPLILRRTSYPPSAARTSMSCFSVIGECYVEGVMDGELLEGNWREQAEEIALS